MMKKQLENCISILQVAKGASCGNTPNPELALLKLEEANKIIAEFAKIDKEEKKQYLDDILEIQALSKIVNNGLAKYKKQLETKMSSNKSRAKAVKGYAAFM